MSGLTDGLDVSNWQGDIKPLLVQIEPRIVVVRLSTETPQLRALAQQQLQTAFEHGCYLAGYVWATWANDPAAHTLNALSVAADYRLEFAAVDCEDGNNVPDEKIDGWLSTSVEQIERKGLAAWVYGNKSFLEANLGDWQAFARLNLWLADWDGVPKLTSAQLPVCAWTTLAGKQWREDPDRNVFDVQAVFPDPLETLKAKIRALIAPGVRMNRKKIAALVGG